jgi:hypothetical protein
LSQRRERIRAGLNVPHVEQGEEEYYCVPACISMVVRFHVETMGAEIPNPPVSELASAMGTDASGTSLNDVVRANRTLRGRSHFLELKPRRNCEFRDIKKQVQEEGRPVIAWIKPHREDRIGHSVVVKEVDPSGLKLTIDDPARGEWVLEVTEFLRVWGNSHYVLIEATVDNKPPQSDLREFE